MHESEFRGMKHQARRRNDRSTIPANINALADDGVTRFRKVNSNLMGAACFKATRDERAGTDGRGD